MRELSAADRIKRSEIMRAAEGLFRNRRFHEVTLDRVAEVAKVGKGTIYRFFQDKDDLFFQTATSGFDELCARLEEQVREGARFEERLLTACARISSFFEERRPLFYIMQSEEIHAASGKRSLQKRWQKARRKLIGALAAIIKQGVKGSQIRAEVPAEVLAAYLFGMLRTRARELADAPGRIQRLELMLEIFCKGAGCGPGRNWKQE
jgi:AcrR family transcriptional regulator